MSSECERAITTRRDELDEMRPCTGCVQEAYLARRWEGREAWLKRASGPIYRMIASAGRQLASVGNLAARDRSNLRNLDRRHDGRVAVQSRELDLKRLAVWVDVHHSPYVADLQTFLRDRSRQNDPVVFCDHPEISPLARIGCHQPRRFQAPIDDPDSPGDPTVATLSLRRQRAVDNIFLAMRRLDAFDDFPGLSNLAQGSNQEVRGIDGEAERLEEVRLPTIVGMGRIQKVVDDLVAFDYREMRVSQFHRADAILPRASASLKQCAKARSHSLRQPVAMERRPRTSRHQ
jgi:hypothetical protein